MNSRPIIQKTIEEYLDENGSSPFQQWFERLNANTATKVITAITKVENGNMGNTASVGNGVHEIKIDYGPGYRVYFANINNTIVLLLGGGSKKGQQQDILSTKGSWEEFKKRSQLN